MTRLGKLEGTLLLSFLLLFCFSLLYIFRSFDSNTLVSWKWVFTERGFIAVLPFLFSGIVISLIISRYIPLERYPIPVLSLLAGITSIFLFTAPEIMLDSGRYFLQAKYLSQYGTLYFFREWGHAISSWTDMPLTPFLYGLILQFCNESRVAIQSFNSIVFILTVILTYKIGSRLWDRELGFYAGLLLIGMPYLLIQVPQMLVDVQTMFFHTLAVWCFIEAIRKRGNFSLFLSFLTIMLAVFVKFSTWPMLALLPLTSFFIYLQDRHSIILKRAVLVLVPALILSLIVIYLKLEVFSAQLNIILNYQRPALKLWGEGIIPSLLFQCHPFVAVLSLYSLVRVVQLKDKRFLIVLSYCLLIIPLHINRIRYMIPLLPFISLIAAYGLVAIRETQLRRFTGSLIISSSLVILFVVYLPFLQTTSMMNIKKAGEALNNIEERYVKVTVLPQENSEGSTFIAIPLLDLFTHKQLISQQRWPQAKPEHLSPYSPLLFTWNLNKPEYYKSNNDHVQDPQALVVISSGKTGAENYNLQHASLPEKITHFTRQSGAFRYRTMVSVYR